METSSELDRFVENDPSTFLGELRIVFILCFDLQYVRDVWLWRQALPDLTCNQCIAQPLLLLHKVQPPFSITASSGDPYQSHRTYPDLPVFSHAGSQVN